MAKYRQTPPAYQEYAADMLGNRVFRTMTLAERGLLYTLRLEAWVNGSMPRDPQELATILGISHAEMQGTLSSNVLSFLEETSDGDMEFPDLEGYRAEMARRRAALAANAEKTNQKRRRRDRGVADDAPEAPDDADGVPSSAQDVERDGERNAERDDRRTLPSREEVKGKEGKGVTNSVDSNKRSSHQEWLHEYEKGEQDYRRASRGA